MNKDNENPQLGLGLNDPLGNKLIKTKRKVSNFFTVLEFNPFIKSPINWIISMISLTFIAVQQYYISQMSLQLPSKIPLLSFHQDLAGKLVDSQIYYYLPLISVIIFIVSVFLGFSLFVKNRAFAYTTLFCSFVSLGFLAFIVVEITLTYN